MTFKHLLRLSALLLLGLAACTKTPDANYLPDPLSAEKYPPWDAPVYGYEQMLSFFPTTDYGALNSIYVDANTGNDGSADGTAGNPYQTIGAAVSNHGSPGTIVRVAAGTYREVIEVDVEAGLTQPFVLYSQDGPGMAIIDGEFQADHTVNLRGKYNILDGFEVMNSDRYSVLVGANRPENNPFGGGDAYAVVRNNTVHTSKQDVVKVGTCNFVLIEGNEIYGSLHAVQSDQCIDGVGVYHTICRYNLLRDNGKGGGGYFKGGSTNNIWCYNIVRDMADPSATSEGECFGIQFGGSGQFSTRDQAFYEYPAGHEQLAFNNIFINCQNSGMHIICSWKGKIYNNTFYNCGYVEGKLSDTKAIFHSNPRIGNNDNGIRNSEHVIQNNLVYNDASHPAGNFLSDLENEFEPGMLTHTNNLFYSAGVQVQWNFPEAATTTEIMLDPLLADPENCDFSLMPGSPALDAGISLPVVLAGIVTQDCAHQFNLVSRPAGAAFDIGAYEQ